MLRSLSADMWPALFALCLYSVLSLPLCRGWGQTRGLFFFFFFSEFWDCHQDTGGEYVRLPRLQFICRFIFFCFFLFHKAGWKMAAKVECRWDWIREQKKKARHLHGLLWTELFLFFLFFFSRFNHISIEPSNDTTRTQMYLLSVTVYYDPTFYYNLAKKQTTTSQSAAVIITVLAADVFAARSDSSGRRKPAPSSMECPPTHPVPLLLDPRHFYYGWKSYPLPSENVNGSIQRQ